MADGGDKALMSHSMMNRAPGKRQIKPTAFLLNHLELPDEDEDDDDIEFGATTNKASKEIEDKSKDNDSDDADDNEEDSEESDDDSSNASSSNETNTDTFNIDENDEVPTELICSVCLNQLASTRKECIVKCDKCGVSVHETCYSGIFLEDDNGSNVESWFCEPCLLGAKNLHCELCPETRGAFKLSEFSGQFVHMVCALFTENVTWADNVNLVGASYQEVKHRLFGYKRCSGCSDEISGRTGVATRCELGECNTYYHITCAQRLGLLVDKTDDNEEGQTHPRFLACKAHNRNTDAIKSMKDLHGKFIRQENARIKNPKEENSQVQKDRLNMKNKFDEIVCELQGVSITKPDLHCSPGIRQRYARHIHTSSRLIESFKIKTELFKKSQAENGDDSSGMTSEAIDEEFDLLNKRNKKLSSLKKKLEIEITKLSNLHTKKQTKMYENKKERIQKMKKEIPEMTAKMPKLETQVQTLEKTKTELIDVMRNLGFPDSSLAFSDESDSEKEEDDEEEDKDNEDTNEKAGKENPDHANGSPSPKRKKIEEESVHRVENIVHHTST